MILCGVIESKLNKLLWRPAAETWHPYFISSVE